MSHALRERKAPLGPMPRICILPHLAVCRAKLRMQRPSSHVQHNHSPPLLRDSRGPAYCAASSQDSQPHAEGRTPLGHCRAQNIFPRRMKELAECRPEAAGMPCMKDRAAAFSCEPQRVALAARTGTNLSVQAPLPRFGGTVCFFFFFPDLWYTHEIARKQAIYHLRFITTYCILRNR